MTQLLTEPSTQAEGCEALWNLCTGIRLAKEATIDAGGLTAGLAALSAHAECAQVQEAGCVFLVSLAHGWSEGQDLVASAGARDVATRAMRSHPRHTRIQVLGANLLELLPVEAGGR